jgi:hypothetical protein
MDAALQRLVWMRAAAMCEYCHILQACDVLPFCMDHIIALKHHGETIESNLALACFNCNSYKGSNIAGVDPLTGELTSLFNPRTLQWNDHFEWHEVKLAGRTAIGRTTCDVLAINHPDHLELRKVLMAEGRFAG